MKASVLLIARNRQATWLQYLAVVIPLAFLLSLPYLGDLVWDNQFYFWAVYVIALVLIKNSFDTKCPHCEKRVVVPDWPGRVDNLEDCNACGTSFDKPIKQSMAGNAG